ncbi:phospholipase D delta-like isoform X2 [Apium graveolens]|uniref:phospholipase D delta-like isoform X2 n=1 Tax=Apium graveolens TaxID=4045 RepID=UPI003D7B3A07
MENADDISDASNSVIYLHGDLDLRIIEARCLPNMDLLSEHLRRCFTAFNVCRNPNSTKKPHHKIITSDPYVTVCLSGATVARTRVMSNNQNPIWNEHFQIPLAHPVSQVDFVVKDNDTFGADFIGIASVSAQRIKTGDLIDEWFPIIGLFGKPPKQHAAIRLRMRFLECEDNLEYSNSKFSLQGSYFPMRRGGHVTLYQDAHTPDGMLPEIELEGGKVFRQEKCWEDICHAILEAHHLVYITGWSIYHKVKLVREPSKPLPRGGDLSLGDLLKYKSQEGVRVLLLVWDDKTSHNKFFIRTEGVMQTHDEETRKFFKHSSVNCVLSPRYASSKLSIFKQQAGVLGPRQPWHDLHCKIEGPAAYDVLRNFEQRWKKATKWSEFGRRFKKISRWHDDALIKIERISWILSPSDLIPNDHPILRVSQEDDPENWHVQVFRSIDSGSVKGFPKDNKLVVAQNLEFAKNLVIDKSIQKAYIQAIRCAQHFIYIENQYFLGSSYAWSSRKSAGADNLIPMELALKIASKIRAKKRFAVYIVIPMWPEGNPSSASVQEILFWQGETMKMMYEIIARELQSANFENSHPQDYLNFYCLGNRETNKEIESDAVAQPSNNGTTVVSASQKYGRFMVYVHAKGMIVDDEYVMLGSSNINQRSMAGSRDTEIAMGAYQNHHTWAKKGKHPRGEVYGYRMSLWAEHLGNIDDCFKEPESLMCVKTVNKIATDNWEKFTAEEFMPLQGHLLKYPIQVDSNGKVSSLPGHETFPDCGGKVLGAPTTLPNALTT